MGSFGNSAGRRYVCWFILDAKHLDIIYKILQFWNMYLELLRNLNQCSHPSPDSFERFNIKSLENRTVVILVFYVRESWLSKLHCIQIWKIQAPVLFVKGLKNKEDISSLSTKKHKENLHKYKQVHWKKLQETHPKIICLHTILCVPAKVKPS